MLSVVDVFFINIEAFSYVINEDSRIWSLYCILVGFIYTTSFLFSLFATGTAAMFGGKNGFKQSVWNCSIYSLVSLSIYTSLQISTGIESEIQFFLVQSIIMQILFTIIIFVCLRENKEFMWKNILPRDSNTKLCLKVYLIMFIIFELISFIATHISLNQ